MRGRVGWWQRVVFGAALGCLAFSGIGHTQIVVSSSSAQVLRGGTAAITFSIAGIGGTDNVATYSADVEFDSNNLDVLSTCVGGTNDGNACASNADCPANGLCTVNCTQDARLAQQASQFSRQTAGKLILFVGDTVFPINTFDNGALFSCGFSARANATLGSYLLKTTFLEVANASSTPLTASATDGSITVVLLTPTPTSTPTPVPSATSTPTPTNTAAALCACDCDGDSHVLGSEITKCVLILGGARQQSDCPGADSNHDGRVSGSDITRGVLALGAGSACVRQ